ETFTATINWGDGSAIDNGSVQTVNGSPGVLTTGSVTGTHTYAAVGTFTVTVTVRDDDGGVGTGSFTITVIEHNNTKFYVVDQSDKGDFRYSLTGASAGRTDLVQPGNARPRGIAANAAGDTLWVIDATKTVYVYSAADGSPLGSWNAPDLNQPEDI